MGARSPLRPAAAARVFECGVAARWLPRALAGSVLASALLAALRFAPYREFAAARMVQGVVCVAGLAAAVWILRSASAESRTIVTVDGDGLFLEHGGRNERLEFERIERLEFAWPFGPAWRLLPAAVLIERDGRAWRIPAIVDEGNALIEALVERARRDDLRTWAISLELARRMGRARWIVRSGYSAAAACVLAAITFFLR